MRCPKCMNQIPDQSRFCGFRIPGRCFCGEYLRCGSFCTEPAFDAPAAP